MYDRKNNENFAPMKARQGGCVVGRTANITKALEELSNQFKPQELNEANVQAIFHRCLPVPGCPEVSCELFPPVLGYSSKNYRSSYGFDEKAISANKKNIQYLYGQLHSVHIKKDVLTMDDFSKSYLGETWVSDKAYLLELLYLGNCSGVDLIHPFSARKNDTTRLILPIKPTLSPKDPAFPAWWEAHRAEWETQ